MIHRGVFCVSRGSHDSHECIMCITWFTWVYYLFLSDGFLMNRHSLTLARNTEQAYRGWIMIVISMKKMESYGKFLLRRWQYHKHNITVDSTQQRIVCGFKCDITLFKHLFRVTLIDIRFGQTHCTRTSQKGLYISSAKTRAYNIEDMIHTTNLPMVGVHRSTRTYHTHSPKQYE